MCKPLYVFTHDSLLFGVKSSSEVSILIKLKIVTRMHWSRSFGDIWGTSYRKVFRNVCWLIKQTCRASNVLDENPKWYYHREGLYLTTNEIKLASRMIRADYTHLERHTWVINPRIPKDAIRRIIAHSGIHVYSVVHNELVEIHSFD